MNTSGNSFELILEEILHQKRVLEDLHAENASLRQQLSALRAGQGISIDILGHRILLVSETQDDSSHTDAAVSETPTATFLNVASPQQSEQPLYEAIPSPEASLTPLPESDMFLVEEVGENGTPLPVSSSSFLEEALLDEFSSATTRQMGVWNGPITNHPTLDEQEKAALRRELMGSFLLE